jgi:hypothetical protein
MYYHYKTGLAAVIVICHSVIQVTLSGVICSGDYRMFGQA